MAWTTPRTWTPGELVTADVLNTQVRDNLLHLYGRIGIGARLIRSTNQSIPSQFAIAVQFSSTRYDTDNMFSGGQNTRLTLNTAGKYILSAHLKWDPMAALSEARLRLNGATSIAQQTIANGNNKTVYMSLSTVYSFAAGDYVELMCFQDDTVARNILTESAAAIELAAQWIGE